jgi:copper(I)-binding protein
VRARAVFLLAALASCAPHGPTIKLRHAYAFEPVLGDVGAVYFTIENQGDRPDTLRGVEVAGAGMAMLHEQVATGGQEEMRPVGALPVPAGSTVELKPGGLHLMIEGMAHPPVAGDTLAVTAHFAAAGAITIRAPVLAYGTEP